MLCCFRFQVFTWNTSYSTRNQPILNFPNGCAEQLVKNHYSTWYLSPKFINRRISFFLGKQFKHMKKIHRVDSEVIRGQNDMLFLMLSNYLYNDFKIIYRSPIVVKSSRRRSSWINPWFSSSKQPNAFLITSSGSVPENGELHSIVKSCF